MDASKRAMSMVEQWSSGSINWLAADDEIGIGVGELMAGLVSLWVSARWLVTDSSVSDSRFSSRPQHNRPGWPIERWLAMRWWVSQHRRCRGKQRLSDDALTGRWACSAATSAQDKNTTNDDPISELDVQQQHHCRKSEHWAHRLISLFATVVDDRHSILACYRSMVADRSQLVVMVSVQTLWTSAGAIHTHTRLTWHHHFKGSNITDNCSRYTTLEMISFNSIGRSGSMGSTHTRASTHLTNERAVQCSEDDMRTMLASDVMTPNKKDHIVSARHHHCIIMHLDSDDC